MNKQTWAGEVPMSKRAIVEKDLADFFEKNNVIDRMEVQDWNTEYRKLDELSNWGGPLQRLMMQAIYLIAFTCLLRFDEVLKIQHHHIEVVNPDHGHIRLTLPFRKTYQMGQIKPFALWFNRKNLQCCIRYSIFSIFSISFFNIESKTYKFDMYQEY